MGYRFSGFFIDQDDPQLVDRIRTRWPLLHAQPIHSPFLGYGFAFPDHERCLSDEEAEAILEQRDSASDELPVFSASYPDATFLWVDADCFGGTCLYSGYGCRDGHILVKEESPTTNSLRPLVQVFGVELRPDQYFSPFTRGFFRL